MKVITVISVLLEVSKNVLEILLIDDKEVSEVSDYF